MLELVEQSPLDIINNSSKTTACAPCALQLLHVGPGPAGNRCGHVRRSVSRPNDEQVLLPGRLAQVGQFPGTRVRHGRRLHSRFLAGQQDHHEGGAVAGVELWEGRTLYSNAVISTLDPHTTFLDLVGSENLPGELKESVEGWKYDKWSFNTLHVASEEQPKYLPKDPWASEAFMTSSALKAGSDAGTLGQCGCRQDRPQQLRRACDL